MGKSTKSHPSVSWCIVNHCFAEIAALTHRGRERRVSITYAHMLRVRR